MPPCLIPILEYGDVWRRVPHRQHFAIFYLAKRLALHVDATGHGTVTMAQLTPALGQTQTPRTVRRHLDRLCAEQQLFTVLEIAHEVFSVQYLGPWDLTPAQRVVAQRETPERSVEEEYAAYTIMYGWEEPL